MRHFTPATQPATSPSNLRKSLQFILSHPSSVSVTEATTLSAGSVFRGYFVAACVAVICTTAYEVLHVEPHVDYTLVLFVGFSILLAGVPISTFFGWGPALLYTVCEVLYVYTLLARDPHQPFLEDLVTTLVYAVLFVILASLPASLRLGWSHYFSEQRSHIQALEASNVRLQQESRAKDDFINVASHELRTPLTSLSLSTQLLRHHLPPDDTAVLDARKLRLIRGHVDLMSAQLARVVASLSDMTDAIHLERNTLLMTPEEVDVCSLANHVVEECRVLFDTHAINYKQPAAPLWVIGDAHRFAQAIYHFVSNACKYSPEHEPVRVAVHRQGREVHLAVHDQGYGVPYDKQEEIWTRGYHTAMPQQAHSSHVGLGLGLYISKVIIEQHGGRVGCRSSVGGGSTFWMILPLADRTSLEDQQSASQTQESHVPQAVADNVVAFLRTSEPAGVVGQASQASKVSEVNHATGK